MSRPRQVLVVDDDPAICRVLCAELEPPDTRRALRATAPRRSSRWRTIRPTSSSPTSRCQPRRVSLIKAVRQRSALAIIVLSVRGGDSDKIRALDLGADDYVTKPVSLPELLARVRTQLRRSAPERPVMCFPDLEIDSLRRLATQGGGRCT